MTLEAVCRASETKLQVSEKLNKITYREKESIIFVRGTRRCEEHLKTVSDNSRASGLLASFLALFDHIVQKRRVNMVIIFNYWQSHHPHRQAHGKDALCDSITSQYRRLASLLCFPCNHLTSSLCLLNVGPRSQTMDLH